MPPRAGESGPAPGLPWKPLSVNFIFCLAQLSYRFRKRERNWEVFPSQSEAESKIWDIQSRDLQKEHGCQDQAWSSPGCFVSSSLVLRPSVYHLTFHYGRETVWLEAPFSNC